MSSPVERLQPYDALAAVYDRWTADNDYARWADFVHHRVSRAGGTRMLDLCCGTGTMMRLLQDRGYTVTGVDRSAAMLRKARAATTPDTVLICGEVPHVDLDEDKVFDAVICCFDSVNYFAEDDGLAGLFEFVARRIRPGGLFIFDLNTRHKLEKIFGSTHFGDDHGDFAYIWRNRCQPERSVTEFYITLFVRNGKGFERHKEKHVQRWFDQTEVRTGAREAGLVTQSITDDYTNTPPTPETMRETWVLERTRSTP